ncbi:group II intron maturase-specific domain-containing protein [Mesorhizobium sp.]|uniref:group II intron maturase-specific domain-containing protein n=1 Tax=Mesorhizobium sp. TaxID=1871066 RepID=UPI0025F800BD|nr:group II intron maturase-specific domain-containing protein [Mesorhizobium sp.]
MIAYYGRYSRSALSTLADYINRKLRAWIMRKFKRFQSHKTRASLFVRKLARENPGLFVHWKTFGTNTFA